MPNGECWTVAGEPRLIELVISWMCERKHKVAFGAVSKSKLEANRTAFDLEGFQDSSEWCIAAMHLILGLQRQHQKEKNNKGHTLMVFDQVKEQNELLKMRTGHSRCFG